MVNSDAAAFLSGENSLLDAALTRLCIEANRGDAVVTLRFAMSPHASVSAVTIVLKEVRELWFGHRDDHTFYNVERVKCLWLDDELYLSLDPFDETDQIRDDDGDVFRARSVLLTAEGAPPPA